MNLFFLVKVKKSTRKNVSGNLFFKLFLLDLEKQCSESVRVLFHWPLVQNITANSFQPNNMQVCNIENYLLVVFSAEKRYT